MYVTFFNDTMLKKQITFQQLYENFDNRDAFTIRPEAKFRHKYTANSKLTPENRTYYMNHYPIGNWLIELSKILETIAMTIPLQEDMSEFYETFQIPKRSGGYRTIEAPNDKLKAGQDRLKNFFNNGTCWLPHDAAYAYVQHRGTKESVEQHKNSNWFLKLDIHGFFPSCNLQTIYDHMTQVFPFALMADTTCRPVTSYEMRDGQYFKKIKWSKGEDILKEAIKYALINDHLPQGTPLSPVLTNILMVPFDTELSRKLPKEFVYTRYADDLLISSPYEFKWQDIQQMVVDLLKSLNYPFQLNTEKTRYGSIAGRNWNLGLMLNKDHKITLGHQQKERLRVGIFNFCVDLTKGKSWSKIDVQTLQGQLAYAIHIEPDYFKAIITKYETKFHINFTAACRDIINS